MLSHQEVNVNSASNSAATNEELCSRFDSDILYDAHSMNARVRRSDAAKELIARKRASLPAIVMHLRAHTGLDELDLREAWGMLLSDISIRIFLEPAVVPGYNDTSAWLRWAENIIGQE